MKKNICVILIGAASWSSASGQISDMKDLLNLNIKLVTLDPAHNKEPDELLFLQSNIPVKRNDNPNNLYSNCLNVFEMLSENFFANLKPNDDTYYLILSFIGIEYNNPSWQIARKLKIRNKYFYNINNSLCLGFGCLNKPVNLLDLMLTLNINPYEYFDPFYVKYKLQDLISHQEFKYALLNNIDSISRAYINNEKPEWLDKSLKKLRKVNIYSMKNAYDYYNKNIKVDCEREMENIGLLKFFEERKNDFTS